MTESSRAQLRFRFDSRMATLLGEQSVTNSVAAIFELVKNAYDADASLVEVVFHGTREKEKLRVTSIEVRDDGVGMTFEDFRDKWMVVGTYVKERETSSPKLGRRVVGEKGIGRFASQRLGSKITITSDPEEYPARYTEHPGERIIMTIDWERYQPGTTFDEIGNDVQIVDKLSPSRTGLNIRIETLKDEWTEEQIRDLNERIGWLVLPKELAQEASQIFEARIITEGFVLEKLEVEPAFLLKAPYSITTRLRRDKVHYTISEMGEIRRDSRTSTPGQEPITFKGQCGDVEMRLYYYPGDVRGERKWGQYYNKVLGAAQFEDTLEKMHGLKLYNDGVKVLAYGKPGHDWLELNKHHVTRRGSWLRNERVIGFLFLTRKNNPMIKETTTREGIIQNQAFLDLQEFALRVVHELARFSEDVQKREKDRRTIESTPALIASESNQVRQLVKVLPIPDERKQEVIQSLNTIERNVSRMDEQHREEVMGFEERQQLYRNLASIGITTIAFVHEIVHPLSSIDLVVSNMITDMYEGEVDSKLQLKSMIEVSNHVSRLLHWQRYIKAFATLIATSKRTEREYIDVKTFINQMFESFRGVLEERKIDIRNSVADYVPRILINRADLESIFVNLFTNSVKALRAVQDRNRVIRVSIVDSPGHFKFRFSDTGIGIPTSEVHRIFEPLYTTYRGQDSGPRGTGMGLTIVREILEKYGGKIEVEKPELNGGATFLLSIPWREIQANDKQS
ncbi:MAG: sensor histidine kinase [Thaumarchaeota archaeon]|nr:sensor histidine kinase [Nitrososphaerota archaeon]